MWTTSDPRFGSATEISILLTAYSKGGAPAILLEEADSGAPYATATVNFPGELAPDEVAVKSHSDGEGMAEVLIAAGVIEPQVLREIDSGYVSVPVYRLTPRARSAIQPLG